MDFTGQEWYWQSRVPEHGRWAVTGTRWNLRRMARGKPSMAITSSVPDSSRWPEIGWSLGRWCSLCTTDARWRAQLRVWMVARWCRWHLPRTVVVAGFWYRCESTTSDWWGADDRHDSAKSSRTQSMCSVSKAHSNRAASGWGQPKLLPFHAGRIIAGIMNIHAVFLPSVLWRSCLHHASDR